MPPVRRWCGRWCSGAVARAASPRPRRGHSAVRRRCRAGEERRHTAGRRVWCSEKAGVALKKWQRRHRRAAAIRPMFMRATARTRTVPRMKRVMNCVTRVVRGG